MDKTITTALLIIAGVICMIFVFNSVYPMINRSSQAMTSMADTIDERMKSRINIVHAANDGEDVYIWIKNVGSTRIVSIEKTDVFFGSSDDFSRVPYVADAQGSYPYWIYNLENDTENGTVWLPSVTLKITITYNSAPGAGTYSIKIIIPNGISDEYYFSM